MIVRHQAAIFTDKYNWKCFIGRKSESYCYKLRDIEFIQSIHRGSFFLVTQNISKKMVEILIEQFYTKTFKSTSLLIFFRIVIFYQSIYSKNVILSLIHNYIILQSPLIYSKMGTSLSSVGSLNIFSIT